jgi:hypothetical protein
VTQSYSQLDCQVLKWRIVTTLLTPPRIVAPPISWNGATRGQWSTTSALGRSAIDRRTLPRVGRRRWAMGLCTERIAFRFR